MIVSSYFLLYMASKQVLLVIERSYSHNSFPLRSSITSSLSKHTNRASYPPLFVVSCSPNFLSSYPSPFAFIPSPILSFPCIVLSPLPISSSFLKGRLQNTKSLKLIFSSWYKNIPTCLRDLLDWRESQKWGMFGVESGEEQMKREIVSIWRKRERRKEGR